MGYLEDLREVIKIHEFQIALNKEFFRRNQFDFSLEELGGNKEHYSREFKGKIEEYTILQLWTIFERHLFELTDQYIRRNQDEGTVRYAIEGKIAEKIERWSLGEILDLYKIIIDPDTVGMIKQIKRYRDWLVHKNPRKASPGKISYEDTYIYLSEFLNSIKSDLSRLVK